MQTDRNGQRKCVKGADIHNRYQYQKESGIMISIIIPEFMLSSASLTALCLFNLFFSPGMDAVIDILVIVLPPSAVPPPGEAGVSVRKLVIFEERTHQHNCKYNHYNDYRTD